MRRQTTWVPRWAFRFSQWTTKRRRYSSAVICSFHLNIWDIGGQGSIRKFWSNYYEEVDTFSKHQILDRCCCVGHRQWRQGSNGYVQAAVQRSALWRGRNEKRGIICRNWSEPLFSFSVTKMTWTDHFRPRKSPKWIFLAHLSDSILISRDPSLSRGSGQCIPVAQSREMVWKRLLTGSLSTHTREWSMRDVQKGRWHCFGFLFCYETVIG